MGIDIKNHTCFYFDDIIRSFFINFDNILLDKKLYENVFSFWHFVQNFNGSKPLRLKFDKIDGFISVHGGEL